MNFESKILFSKDYRIDADYEEFNIEIKSSLATIEPAIVKRVLITVTEIIQNKIIHNPENFARLEIQNHQNVININFSQFVNENDFNLITKIIDEVNSLSQQELKMRIAANIMNPQKEQGCGNGLIACRLKTQNKIKFEIINKVSINSINMINCLTTLTISKYDKKD